MFTGFTEVTWIATVLGSAFRVVLCGTHTPFTFPFAHAVSFGIVNVMAMHKVKVRG